MHRMVALGGALADAGEIALGCWGGPEARMSLRALALGLTAAGGRALCHDLETPAQAAWLARDQQLVSLFAKQEGEGTKLYCFGTDGLAKPLPEPGETGEKEQVRAGETVHLHLTTADYAADAVRQSRLYRRGLRALKVAVPGDDPAERSLRQALSLLGCTVVRDWSRGIPAFGVEQGGFCLTAQDERGVLLETEQLLPLVCLIEMENGGGRVAVPDDAGAAVDLVAAGLGGSVLRPGRDGARARELYASLPWMRDGVFAAVRICQRMLTTGESLESLISKTPRFGTRRREVLLETESDLVIKALARERGREPVGGGLHFRSGGSWVHLTPAGRRRALQVAAEGPDMEAAAELCDFYVKLCGQTDKRLQGRPVEN